jgi:hypothetical protein
VSKTVPCSLESSRRDGKVKDVTPSEPTYETVTTDELARLRRIEEAARHLLDEWPGSRSATPLLKAIVTLRATLKEKPQGLRG